MRQKHGRLAFCLCFILLLAGCASSAHTGTPAPTAIPAPLTAFATAMASLPSETATTPSSPTPAITSAPAPTAQPEMLYITANNVNFRAEASLKAVVLQRLPAGKMVLRHSQTGNWSCVELDGVMGYVASEYLSVDAPALPSAPAPTPRPPRTGAKPLVAIDAGHQRKADPALEAIGPGAAERKPKVAAGTTGVASGVPEYQLTLEVSLQLKAELLARGYEVYMIRETHEVNISNRERAAMAAAAGADILVRVHVNGSENQNENGILTISPSANTPYVPQLYNDSRKLSGDLLSGMVAATGAANRGVWETDTMSGINWSSIPVSIVEMGYMSNPAEDQRMQTADYQQKLVQGMADGVDRYFG